MGKYSFGFFLKQSLSGLFKNGLMTLTSIFVLMSCLILMGCFSLLIYNINANLQDVSLFNKIIVMIDKGTPSERVEEIGEQILASGNTSSCVFVSKDEALNRVRETSKKENRAIFDLLKGDKNPLRDSYEIEYKNIDDINTYVYFLRNIEGIEIKNKIEYAQQMNNIINFVKFVLFWFLIILLIIAIFIIVNTIKLSVHIRKNEITYMRYIGATSGFILFPFLLEGIIIGTVSAMSAYALQSYIYSIIQRSMTSYFAIEIYLVKFSEISILVLLAFLGVGILSGLLGSTISAKKYLKA